MPQVGFAGYSGNNAQIHSLAPPPIKKIAMIPARLFLTRGGASEWPKDQHGNPLVVQLPARTYRCTDGSRQTGVYYRAALKASKGIVTFFGLELSSPKQLKGTALKCRQISAGDMEQSVLEKRHQYSVGNKMICLRRHNPSHLHSLTTKRKWLAGFKVGERTNLSPTLS